MAAAIVLSRGIEAEAGPEAWIGLAQLGTFAVGAVVGLCWFYRANTNARALGARDMIVSPGWAVGWWFVPLANLVMPFMTLREMWKASANPRDWEAERAPHMTGWWWGLWLLSGFTGMLSLQLLWAGGKDAFAASEMLLIVSDLSYVPAAILFARIVASIETMQRRHAAGR